MGITETTSHIYCHNWPKIYNQNAFGSECLKNTFLPAKKANINAALQFIPFDMIK